MHPYLYEYIFQVINSLIILYINNEKLLFDLEVNLIQKYMSLGCTIIDLVNNVDI